MIVVGRQFPEGFFVPKKAKKNLQYNRGFCATGADGCRVSTFVTFISIGPGGRNTAGQFANHHQYLLIWLQLAGADTATIPQQAQSPEPLPAI